MADANAGERFLAAAKEKTALVSMGDNRMAAFLGKEDWPFPIPMVKGTSGWTFDSAVGAEELVNRRIGKNELNTIAVLHTFVDAQNEFAAAHKEPHYAQKLISTEGTHDGLFWKVKEGEPESPLGPLAVEASEEGYRRAEPGSGPTPFHGYFFKILTAQGKDAPGGEKTYINKEGQDDWRIRPRGVALQLRGQRHHDLHREPAGHRLPARSGPRHARGRQGHDRVQPRTQLDSGEGLTAPKDIGPDTTTARVTPGRFISPDPAAYCRSGPPPGEMSRPMRITG